MNQSLSEPDYLQCSITRNGPVKPLIQAPPRQPILTYQHLLNEVESKRGPMAARVPQDHYPGEEKAKHAQANLAANGKQGGAARIFPKVCAG